MGEAHYHSYIYNLQEAIEKKHGQLMLRKIYEKPPIGFYLYIIEAQVITSQQPILN